MNFDPNFYTDEDHLYFRLTKLIETSAIFFEGLLEVPEKITSSIPDPRILFAEVSPIHHLKRFNYI